MHRGLKRVLSDPDDTGAEGTLGVSSSKRDGTAVGGVSREETSGRAEVALGD